MFMISLLKIPLSFTDLRMSKVGWRMICVDTDASFCEIVAGYPVADADSSPIFMIVSDIIEVVQAEVRDAPEPIRLQIIGILKTNVL